MKHAVEGGPGVFWPHLDNADSFVPCHQLIFVALMLALVGILQASFLGETAILGCLLLLGSRYSTARVQHIRLMLEGVAPFAGLMMLQICDWIFSGAASGTLGCLLRWHALEGFFDAPSSWCGVGWSMVRLVADGWV
eukprot:CAMPEP_0204262872 /NCGR_PEP_ID=MMETSP0468-20130131/7964_1 /ASSEMBLY_ACC=CAM_ASM_000383 /TAXON_ID=2969 /ORGANISM="Oxyrrhis marina" /LENGTH=136 /DNA_ID=CAMNT_0051237575 /DNA_START=155 /DNA_END=562 /DNA_ORIENTATION=-